MVDLKVDEPVTADGDASAAVVGKMARQIPVELGIGSPTKAPGALLAGCPDEVHTWPVHMAREFELTQVAEAAGGGTEVR